jgi:hypothetical protein
MVTTPRSDESAPLERFMPVAVIAVDPVARERLRRIVATAGYAPFLFACGDTAYRQLRDFVPAAIIVYLAAPALQDAVPALHRMRRDPALSGAPLILYAPDHRSGGAAAWPEDCLVVSTPCDTDDLLHLLQQRSRRPATSGATGAAAPCTPSGSVSVTSYEVRTRVGSLASDNHD